MDRGARRRWAGHPDGGAGPAPVEGLVMEGMVKMIGQGVRLRLARDPEARRWVKRLGRTVVLEMEGMGAVTVRFRSGRIQVRPGASRFAHYRVQGPYEDLVGYMNGEVGLTEILGKLATGRIRVSVSTRARLHELLTILRLEEIFVIARKREAFPASLAETARRAALFVPRAIPLLEILPI